MKGNAYLAEVAKAVRPGAMTPRMYRAFKDYLSVAPARYFKEKYVVNPFIPPFPGKAFDKFVDTFFGDLGAGATIHSADIAVTNACVFNCYHCYNANRVILDLPADVWQRIVRDLCDLGATTLGVGGGEPCLRPDLPVICRAIPEDCAAVLSTTGFNFGDETARALKDTSVYGVAISLDSADEESHDRLRGRKGAFRIALDGIERALQHGFYTYVCTVPTKRLLSGDNFHKVVDLAARLGVPEVQVIEPAPAGRLLQGRVGRFGMADFELVQKLMREVNSADGPVIVTSFAHMESPDTFGCGAGTSHIYVDGTGEVSPCNMLPVSYGNAADEQLSAVVARMQRRFGSPCTGCLAFALEGFFKEHARGTLPVRADALPEIPKAECEASLPTIFQIIADRATERAGAAELRQGYNEASQSYNDYWLTVAGAPIDAMFARFPAAPGGKALDCGCGTGYSTARLLDKVGPDGTVLAVDLSPGMIEKARARLRPTGGLDRVTFKVGDVLAELRAQPEASFDAVAMTWLIGYVACADAFPLVRRVLKPGGAFGFVAHLDRSPLIPIEEFEALAREEPEAFEKYVRFHFPVDGREVTQRLRAVGLQPVVVEEGAFDFVCDAPQEVYDHLIKSGAGTTYWLALKPEKREPFRDRFIERIARRFRGRPRIVIDHQYVLGVAHVE